MIRFWPRLRQRNHVRKIEPETPRPPPPPQRWVECAAVRVNNTGEVYALCRPNRHCNVLWFIHDEFGHAVYDVEQGFLDNRGQFLGRFVAAVLAYQAGQIPRSRPTLYTEDLWQDESPDYYPPPEVLSHE